MSSSATLAGISAVTALLWLVAITLLHFIKPELDPRTHMISEYARGPKGWIMGAAFFCMAMSCWSLAFSTWAHMPHLGLALLVICGVGFAGAGGFVTDTVSFTKGAGTRTGRLHVIFSLVVIPLFPLMATIVTAGMAGNPGSASIRFWLPVLSVLTWTGLVCFLGGPAIYSGSVASGHRGYHFHRYHRVPGAHPLARRRIFALPVAG